MTIDTDDWLFGIFTITIVKILIIDPELERWRLQKSRKASKSQPINPLKIEQDFYGLDLMQADPKKFLQNVAEIKKKMAIGEDNVRVNAAEFAFIRTENKVKIFSDGHGGIIYKPVKERFADQKPPAYVDHVEYLDDGGVRWI